MSKNLFLAVLAIVFSGCTGSRPANPEPIYLQEASRGIDRLQEDWFLEGTGRVYLQDNGMHLQEDSAGVGVVLWLRKEIPADFRLEFEVSFSNNRGIGVFFFAASGPGGEDLLTGTAERSGEYDEYIRSDLRSYSFSMHRYWPDGRNNPGANLRRNPGFHLVSQALPDPMLESGRRYAVALIRKEGRIRISVDGKQIHDWTDEGSMGPVHGSGKIGFRHRGDHRCVMTIGHIRITPL